MSADTPTHPGSIVFLTEGRSPRIHPAREVPQTVAFVVEGERLHPVLRVVSERRGHRRVVRSYGEGGRLLQTTFEALGRP